MHHSCSSINSCILPNHLITSRHPALSAISLCNDPAPAGVELVSLVEKRLKRRCKREIGPIKGLVFDLGWELFTKTPRIVPDRSSTQANDILQHPLLSVIRRYLFVNIIADVSLHARRNSPKMWWCRATAKLGEHKIYEQPDINKITGKCWLKKGSTCKFNKLISLSNLEPRWIHRTWTSYVNPNL